MEKAKVNKRVRAVMRVVGEQSEEAVPKIIKNSKR